MKKRTYEHLKAQKSAKELDEFACFICGITHKGNHGHHIIPYSEGGDASIRNMITLCPICHREYHAGKLKIDIGRF